MADTKKAEDPQDEGLTDEEREMLERSIERNREALERLAEL